MPRNFKEELLFTAVMAGLMVLVMAGYNIALADGFGHHFIREVLVGYPLGLTGRRNLRSRDHRSRRQISLFPLHH